MILGRLIFAFCIIAVLVLGAGASDFARRMHSTEIDAQQLPSHGVVFTGQFYRIRFGLGLMDQGKIGNLLISGVNPGAGIFDTSRFADQFALSPFLVEAMQQGRLMLGTDANTTFENAGETRCWVRQENYAGPMVLITSALHMPRASLALEHALPGRRIVRVAVADEPAGLAWADLCVHEFAKYLASIVVLGPGMISGKDLLKCDPG